MTNASRSPASRGRVFLSLGAVLVLFAVTSVFVTRQSMLYEVERRIGDRLTDVVGAFRSEIEEGVAAQTDTLEGAVNAVAPSVGPDAALALYLDERRTAATPGFGRLFVPESEDTASEEARWAAVTTSERGTFPTADGLGDYLAVPIVVGDEVDGVVVALLDANALRSAAAGTVRTVAVAVTVLLAIGLLLAWWAAGRLATSLRVSPQRVRRGEPVPPPTASPAPSSAGDPAPEAPYAPAAAALRRSRDDDRGSRHQTSARGTRGGKARTPHVTVERGDVEINRLTLDIYSRAQQLADREWALEVPSNETVALDPAVVTMAAARLTENAVSRTSTGDTIVVGSSMSAGTASIHVTTMVPDEGCAQVDSADRFDVVMATHTEDGARSARQVQAAVAAHGGRVEVDCGRDGGVRVTMILPVGGR